MKDKTVYILKNLDNACCVSKKRIASPVSLVFIRTHCMRLVGHIRYPVPVAHQSLTKQKSIYLIYATRL